MKLHLSVLLVAIAACVVFSTPVSAAPRVTLTYFDSRGRAEPIRMLLEFLRVPFKDVRFQSRQQWLDVKESGKFAFNQVPALTWCEDRDDEDTCFTLVQSHTIMRFLSRKYNHYLDEDKRVWVDMVADGAEDFKSRLSKVVYNSNGTALLPEYLETTTPTWLGFFERLKERINGGKFFVADTITHADIFLFYIVETHRRLAGPDMLADFPLLQAWFNEVAAEDTIDNWRRSMRRNQFVNGVSASVDNPNSPPPFTDTGEPWPVEAESDSELWAWCACV